MRRLLICFGSLMALLLILIIPIAIWSEGKHSEPTVTKSSKSVVTADFSTNLPAPEVLNLPPSRRVQAQPDGCWILEIKPVDGAISYSIKILNEASKRSYASRFETPSGHTLANLKPGVYKISIASVNQKSITGSEGQAFWLTVPNTSNIAAPTLSKIQIEDSKESVQPKTDGPAAIHIEVE